MPVWKMAAGYKTVTVTYNRCAPYNLTKFHDVNDFTIVNLWSKNGKEWAMFL
jgi:hypothetical protein